MTNNTEDMDLINGYFNGDRSCLDKIAEKYKDEVFSFCLVKLKHWQDAEDASEELFCDIENIVKRYKRKRGAKFSSYLLQIAFYKCCDIIDYRKKQRENITENIDDLIETEDGKKLPREYPDNKLSPLDELIAKERAELLPKILRKALLSLSEEHRLMFYLIVMREKSYEEASEIIGIPVGTVGSRLSEAKRYLKDKLKDEEILS